MPKILKRLTPMEELQALPPTNQNIAIYSPLKLSFQLFYQLSQPHAAKDIMDKSLRRIVCVLEENSLKLGAFIKLIFNTITYG
jgi:hypothetical protein